MNSSVALLLQSFTEAYKNRLDEKTIVRYRKATEKLFSYCEKPYDEITTQDIRKWMSNLNMLGYMPGTIVTKLNEVRLFFRYSLEEELIKKNPVESLQYPKRVERLPQYLEVDQLIQLRNLVKGRFSHRAIVEVFYATGVRISELIAMKKEDINWNERSIFIPKGKGKKGRIVLFTLECEQHLKTYLTSRKDDLPYVFVNASETKSIAQTTIRDRFGAYSKILGFRIYPHMLRYTFTVHLAMKGMPLDCIQVLLGHEDPNTTHFYARLYSHARTRIYEEIM